MATQKAVWLDCDPGHDDAIALLFALFGPGASNVGDFQKTGEPTLQLLGCSVVAGNAPVSATFANAARLLEFYQAPRPVDFKDYDGGVHLFMGSEVPLLKPPRSDPAIHGEDGLGGVTGLPPLADVAVQKRVWASYGEADRSASKTGLPPASPGQLLGYWSNLLSYRIARGLPKMTLIVTGPLTNVALLIRTYPELVDAGVEEIVIMGGSPPGERGNRGPLAEFNILVDPEAAAIVFDYNLPVVMAGLNVTHQAIFTRQMREKLLLGAGGETSPFRKTIDSILSFFATTYASEFGFADGPPVHDVLAVAYVIDPKIFYGRDTQQRGKRAIAPKRYKVDVETASSLAMGATVVDFYAQKFERPEPEWWGRGGRNVCVLEDVDVDRLWDLFFASVESAEARRVTA